MNNEQLKERLSKLPDELFYKQLEILKLEENLVEQKFLFSNLKYNTEMNIDKYDENNKKKTLKELEVELKSVLSKDRDYNDMKNTIDRYEKQIKKEKLKLEYLKNQKSCYCAHARLGDYDSHIN